MAFGDGQIPLTKVNQTNYKVLLLAVVMLIALNLLLLSGQFEFSSNNVDTSNGDSLQESLGKHILLPEEEPTIVEVLDEESVKSINEEFYEKVAKEDVIFIYSQTAIVYRPSEDIIVVVSSIVPVE